MQELANLRRYVLTGAPGSGKTAIIRQLEVDGFGVVEEAATALIALKQAQGLDEPWSGHSFIDEVTDLQRIRLLQSSYAPGEVQFHDRSIFCTAALSDYLGRPRSLVLSRELERVVTKQFYQPEVFFIRSLGFIAPPQRGASVSKRRSVSNVCTKRFIGTLVFNLSLSDRHLRWIERIGSKPSFVKSESAYRPFCTARTRCFVRR